MKGVSNIELTNVQTSTFIWTMYYIYIPIYSTTYGPMHLAHLTTSRNDGNAIYKNYCTNK